MPPYDWANGGSVDIFWDGDMVLVLWENRQFTILELKSKPISSPSGKQYYFFYLLYLESGFLSLAYLTAANLARLRISVHC